MRKKIIAGLLALVVLATPITAFGAVNVTIDNAQVVAAVENVSQFIVIENGRPYLPLRAVAEAYGGIVGWDQDTLTVTISFNGLDRAVAFDSAFGTSISGAVRPGNFTLELAVGAGGNLFVRSGPAAGTHLVAYMINDRFMFPVVPIPQDRSVDGNIIYGMLNLDMRLIEIAAQALTGLNFSYNITSTGIVVTLN
ncbi:MAG: copper amine oxidase N-terminal domain-containing protein [Clostridiales bacterium]|nr:copper amine oxidase N-terminal domain-containing protein [Clostridiales bacterium]